MQKCYSHKIVNRKNTHGLLKILQAGWGTRTKGIQTFVQPWKGCNGDEDKRLVMLPAFASVVHTKINFFKTLDLQGSCESKYFCIKSYKMKRLRNEWIKGWQFVLTWLETRVLAVDDASPLQLLLILKLLTVVWRFLEDKKKCLNTLEIYGPRKHNAATPYVVKSNTCQDLVLFWGS